MAGYVRRTIADFLVDDAASILGSLHGKYAADGFFTQYTEQTRAWEKVVPLLRREFQQLVARRPEAEEWIVIVEYPLYRLRRRIDLVVLAGAVVIVIESKVDADEFNSADRRQVEEYALDLRDFHSESLGRRILPILWSTAASAKADVAYPAIHPRSALVAPVAEIGADGLAAYLSEIDIADPGRANLIGETWDASLYKPVPNVIEAATSIFAGHDVRDIAIKDADNLEEAAARLVVLIEEAREERRRYLLILTGVPGSGKTLAGLHVVHSASSEAGADRGDVVYLSGNMPLVVVLREALAQDFYNRGKRRGEPLTLKVARRDARARIQHLNDFLQESLRGSPKSPPHEHVIVFDEAQRAWDEKQGQAKFQRNASESALILEMMARHENWCVCVCLIGGGQEINSGEEGVFGWGDALRKMSEAERREWTVFAPPDVVHGGTSAGSFTLGEMPSDLNVNVENDLQLRVPLRSFRSPQMSQWVDYVLEGNASAAASMSSAIAKYPIVLTRSVAEAKRWLRENGRGERRYGLLASSGARRLRADGLGVSLNASSGDDIANWYLDEPGDIRSSYALEVISNEYTCQGLELAFACVCWGGDYLWDQKADAWAMWRLAGASWQRVRSGVRQRYLLNSYRVLLTRAREGLVLWIPEGDEADDTRAPGPLNDTAEFLISCGVQLLKAKDQDLTA